MGRIIEIKKYIDKFLMVDEVSISFSDSYTFEKIGLALIILLTDGTADQVSICLESNSITVHIPCYQDDCHRDEIIDNVLNFIKKNISETYTATQVNDELLEIIY